MLRAPASQAAASRAARAAGFVHASPCGPVRPTGAGLAADGAASSSASMPGPSGAPGPASSARPQALPNAERTEWGTPLYPGHRPVTPFQRALLAVGSAFVALANPERGDMVAVLGETTGLTALARMRDTMQKDPTGRIILAERPLVTEETVNMKRLRTLPEGSFGREYANWMGAHVYTPDERARVRFVDDAELAYVMQRYREAHDFWHVLLGVPPSVLGELAVKWVEAVQTGLPMTALAGLVGPARLTRGEREQLLGRLVPWAVRCARSAPFLMNVYYERHLEEPIGELRARLRLLPPPPTIFPSPVNAAGAAPHDHVHAHAHAQPPRPGQEPRESPSAP
eukprot:tig00000403_g324.t1